MDELEVQGLREAKIHVTGGHQQRRDDHNDRYAAALAEAHQKENTDTFNRPKIYCFWLSIGVITTSTATGDSTSASNQKETFHSAALQKLTP